MISLSRRMPAALAALALLSAAPAALPAQESAAVVLGRLQPGDAVRVQLRGGYTAQGTLVRADADSVRVRTDTQLLALPLSGVGGVWVRGRHTTRGALIGGGAGLLAGVGLGSFFALLTDNEDEGALVAAMGAAGGLAGGTGGAILGTAVPRWRRVFRADGVAADPADPVYPVEVTAVEPPPSAGGPAATSPATERRRLGSLTVSGGFAKVVGDGGTGGGPEARVSFLGEWYVGGRPGGRRAFVSLGPEVGYGSLGRTPVRQEVRTRCDPTCVPERDTTVYQREYDVLVARALVRAGVEDGRLRAYAVGGAGLHGWRTNAEILRTTGYSPVGSSGYDAIGGTYGAGLQLRTGPGDAVGVEVRRNDVRLHDLNYAHGYWALSATYTRSW